MGELAEGTVQLLNYLISGFLTAWIFYSLTPFKLSNQFERIVQALVFTVIIKSTYYLIEAMLLVLGLVYSFGSIYPKLESILSILIACLYGLIFSYLSNNDYIHKFLRRFRITQEHSYVSEWFSAFKINHEKFIIIQTKNESTFDGQRIYGFPFEFPSQDSVGHFNIFEPSWVVEHVEEIEGEEEVSTILLEMSGVQSILIASKDIAWIEFIEPAEIDSNTNETE